MSYNHREKEGRDKERERERKRERERESKRERESERGRQKENMEKCNVSNKSAQEARCHESANYMCNLILLW